ncbi:MAG: hypothetical protein PHQ00_01880 [Phycisphaerae bacterium]|nr:hypothetical protein [Phycisphaerae bacterium]
MLYKKSQIELLFHCSQGVFPKQNTIFVFSPFKFFLLIFCVCFILFCRRPEALLEPQFFAEDGSVFFKDAYELSFLSSVMKTYAGYYHIVPRLFAEFASFFPVRLAPLLYNSFSLIIAAICFGWIWLPHFRHLIRSDFTRLLLVLIFTLLPNQESLMKLSYIQWYFLLWLTLCSFMLPVKNRIIALVLTSVNILSVWTSVASFVLLPIWGMRFFFSDRFHKLMNAAIILSSIAVIALLYFNNAAASGVYTNSNIPFIYLIKGLFHAVLYKVICSGILGPDITYGIFSHGWKYIYVTSFLLVSFLLILWSFVNWRMLVFALITTYISLASVFLFIFRQSFVISFIHGEGVRVHDRYFFLPVALFSLAIIAIAAQYFQKVNVSGRKRSILGLALLFWILFNTPSFTMRWTSVNLEWPKYAGQIEITQKKTAILKQAYLLKIPINPPPSWTIDLNIGHQE